MHEKKIKSLSLILIIGIVLISCNQNSKCQNKTEYKFPVLKGSYFGRIAPKGKAEVFMDGIISKIDKPEMCAAFTKEGKEFYFNAIYNENWTIFVTRNVNEEWTNPEPINFTSDYIDRDFTISPDGNKLYFGSNRPRIAGEEKLESFDLYVSEKIADNIWCEPRNIGEIVNTDFSENYPSVDAIGNLYFFSNRGEGLGGCEIYTSQFIDNEYINPELLGGHVNSNKNDWDSFIASDGSYIILSSQNRDDTMGKQDLYISFKDSKGAWTKVQNMGERVNSTSDEICPSVSLDGKILFFTSRRRGKADIFWVDAKVIEDLKPEDLN